MSPPLWTPATTEAFATYGVVDKGGVKQPVQLPDDVVTAFRGLEVQTSSTQLEALGTISALGGCAAGAAGEQASSRPLTVRDNDRASPG